MRQLVVFQRWKVQVRGWRVQLPARDGNLRTGIQPVRRSGHRLPVRCPSADDGHDAADNNRLYWRQLDDSGAGDQLWRLFHLRTHVERTVQLASVHLQSRARLFCCAAPAAAAPQPAAVAQPAGVAAAQPVPAAAAAKSTTATASEPAQPTAASCSVHIVHGRERRVARDWQRGGWDGMRQCNCF